MNVNGMEKDFIVDTGSPISIKPADENILKKTELQKTKHRYQDINRNEVKCRGQIPTDIEYENKKQKLQKPIIITKRDDLSPSPLLGLDWMKKINLTIRNIRTVGNNQSERETSDRKVPRLSQENTTKKIRK